MEPHKNIEDLNYRELQAIAKKLGIKANMKKELIIEAINASRSGGKVRESSKKKSEKIDVDSLSSQLASTSLGSTSRSCRSLGWSELGSAWKRRVGNNTFCKMECGSEGDCLFYAIGDALGIPMRDLRNLLADRFIEMAREGNNVLTNYYHPLGDFEEYPTIQTFANAVRETGSSGEMSPFMGDFTAIGTLQELLNIGIVILNAAPPRQTEAGKIYCLGTDFKNFGNFMMLYYTPPTNSLVGHYQLVGFNDGREVITVFPRQSLPPIIEEIYGQDCKASLLSFGGKRSTLRGTRALAKYLHN